MHLNLVLRIILLRIQVKDFPLHVCKFTPQLRRMDRKLKRKYTSLHRVLYIS